MIPLVGGVREHALAAVDQQVPGELARLVGRRGARPHRDDRRAELGRDVDRRAEQVDAPLAAVGDQRREVLAARVEHEARARLHHRVHPQRLELGRAAAPRARAGAARAGRSGCGPASARRRSSRSRPAARARPRAGGPTTRSRHTRSEDSRPAPPSRDVPRHVTLSSWRPCGRSATTRPRPRPGRWLPSRRAGRPPAGSGPGCPRRRRAACAPATDRRRRRRARGRRSRRRRRRGPSAAARPSAARGG